MMRGRWLGGAGGLACALLASCGGGGSGGGGTVAVVPGTPTPSPSPTATATPTPTVSYDIAFDPTRDRFFGLSGAELTSVSSQPIGATASTYSNIAADVQDAVVNPYLNYTADTKLSVLTLNNGAPNYRYDQTQLSRATTEQIAYMPSTGFFTFFRPGPTLGYGPAVLRYTVAVLQSLQVRNAAGGLDNREGRYVGGTATVATDVPAAGVGTYPVTLTSFSQTPTYGSSYNGIDTVQVAVDYGARTVSGTITATLATSGQPGAAPSIAYTFAGQLAAGSGRFTGTVTAPDGGVGRFSGQLFGPAGGELGFVFALRRGEQRVVGTVVGARR